MGRARDDAVVHEHVDLESLQPLQSEIAMTGTAAPLFVMNLLPDPTAKLAQLAGERSTGIIKRQAFAGLPVPVVRAGPSREA